MRKVLMLFFAATLVLAFSWPVQAAGKYLGAPDFTFRGWYMSVGNASDNVLDWNDDTQDSGNAVFSRFRWWFDTSFEGKYGGTIGIEWNWVWGQDNQSTQYLDGLNTILYSMSQGGHGDDLPARHGGPDVWRLKNAYVWFMVPGTPVKITAGLQTFLIDPDIIMHGANGDWWGVRADVPILKGYLNLSAAWMKQDEGANVNFNSDDSDYYWFNLTGALTKWLTYGLYTEWLHVRHNGLTVLDPGRARIPLLAMDGEFLWHGIHMQAKFPFWYAKFHGNYFWGSVNNRFGGYPFLPYPPGGQVRDPNGYALLGEAGITPGPFKIDLQGWYFSGNSSDTWRAGDPGWDRWSSPDAWFAPLEILYSGGRQWGLQTNTAFSVAPGGTAAVALEGDWQVTKKLTLNGIFAYVWATKHRDKPLGTWLNPADGSQNDSDDLGFEFDLRATYKIYDHLSLDLVAAYLIAGDGLESADFVNGGFTGGDDAYELFWRLLYTF